jgi:dihydrofolate reductase
MSTATRPRITLIAAVSADGFISRDHGVPWDLPRDRTHFRAVTAGQWLLLGRRTYEEMIGWFRDHTPLVLTRGKTFTPPIGHTVHSMEDAIAIATVAQAPDLIVCGGSAAYEAAMPHAERLLITRVETSLGSGIPFPPIDPASWRLIASVSHPADAENAHAMRFEEYRPSSSARSLSMRLP